jgi:hypothetical protein
MEKSMARETVQPMESSRELQRELSMVRRMERSRDLLWDQLTESQTEPTTAARSQPLWAWPMEPLKERRWETQRVSRYT